MDLEELRKYKPQIEAIATKYGVTNIRVFGSVARGDARADSDVDLLITPPEEMTLLTHTKFERELSEKLSVKMQTISENGVSKFLKDKIFAEAISI